MDAHPDSSPLTAGPGTPAGSLIAHAELRTILSNLSHELCRPLISLRAGFDLLLGDAARPISHDQLRHTRSYLDYAGLVQGTRPLCYGAFTIGALIREIDRQFAPEASARRIG